MHPLLKLLASNRKRGFFAAETPEGDSATIYLYDFIVDSDDEAEWWGGISPGNFARALDAITAPEIHLRVKSPGGSVFAARAMEQAIREHDSRIITHVDGLAASAASFLILPSDEIIMAPGAFLMIHKAWTMAWGNEADLTKTADLLKQIDGSLVKSYASKTGQAGDEIAGWMAAETWFEADRAVELGFADRVADSEKAKPSEKARATTWDLSAYSNAPKPPATRPAAAPAPEPQPAALQRPCPRALAVALLPA